MKLVRLITICSDEPHIVKYLSDAFPFHTGLKQGVVLTFQLCFGIYQQEGPKNQERLDLHGTYQPMFYADGVNLLDENLNTIKEYWEVHLEVNSQKTKYAHMFMSHDQRAGQNYDMMIHMKVKMSKEGGGGIL
jgi:hypothetical protein